MKKGFFSMKIGEEEIRKAYFKMWYESCKEVYNKKRKEKRMAEKRAKKHGKRNTTKRD